MKKSYVIAQLSENARANEIFNRACDKLSATRGMYKVRPLRSCSASVLETENYFILRSYHTLVAAIEKSSDTLADVLRTEYGYTATSAQHIAKFARDFGSGKWGTENRVRSENLSREDRAKVFYLISETNGNILTLKEARKEWKEDGERGAFWSWYGLTNEPLPEESAPALETA